jgi:hypothetical protein
MHDAIWHWPMVPKLPPPGRFVLICVRTSGRRAEARKEVRAVLRRILAQWSRLSPDEIPLRETLCGPVWQSELQEHLRATSKLSDAPFSLTPALSQGRGSSVCPVGLAHRAASIFQRGPQSLSPRERAGVRGNAADN